METAEKLRALEGNIESVFLGKPGVVRRVIVTLIAHGHLLIEDVPGIGKTLLGIALARSIAASFHRVQFTNDLLPSDILGVSTFNQKDGRFEFREGPIFSNIILADEINRATPKTQSALLEAMSDMKVSIDGSPFPLPQPFMVIATQNPIEYHGTFPLPEAQLDRFFMRVRVGYPSLEEEKAIVREADLYARAGALDPVLTHEEVVSLQERVAKVKVDDALLEYVVKLADLTRREPTIRLGISPRGALFLYRAAQANALIEGRDYCTPDDMRSLAAPVFAHRIIVESNLFGMARIEESERVIEETIRRVPAPV
ncbi:MAG TPA: MoxR family ATPase [bacterium]|nr:MoxR family ATPase [bacterium]